jgi:hypothetical protein
VKPIIPSLLAFSTTSIFEIAIAINLFDSSDVRVTSAFSVISPSLHISDGFYVYEIGNQLKNRSYKWQARLRLYSSFRKSYG